MDTTDNQPANSTESSNLNSNSQMGKKTHCNGMDGDAETVYYGVHIPSDIQLQDSDGYSNVFQDKLEALKVVRKYKKARFKAFVFYHEAVEFAIHGSEFPYINLTPNKSSMLGTPTTPDSPLAAKETTQIPPSVGEKPTPFRGPKSQDLVKLRKGIETGQLDVVQTTIWENPRYLISSGDTPSILQEGSRYNALHVAAKAKNRDMTELILNTISNPSFIKLLYGDDLHQDAEERAKMLLDLYLNTPDKGLNETPLHFAVKFGAVEVVELLVSFPQCDKTVRNKFGKSPNMIICDRCEGSVSAGIKSRMAMLLEETFYVPVLRSENNCTAPVIGEPFAPTSPPNINTDILNPRLEIHAYAGPMNRDGADKFRRVWKTPPRSLKIESPPSLTSQSSALDAAASLKFKDLDKGLERVGRVLASKFDVGWKEYWPFLGGFVDLASPEGLAQLESYLGERANAEENTCSSTSSPKYTSSSESELICSNANNSLRRKVEATKEEEGGMDVGLSPISDLCKDLEACTLSDGGARQGNNHVIKIRGKVNTGSSAPTDGSPDLVIKPELSPFLCVEKSCQVFAHRISNDILHLLESDYSTSNTIVLEVQVKQLQLLMASFMDDSRFTAVDFHLVHYRLGYLISSKLRDFLVLDDEYEYMRRTLQSWLDNCGKHFLDCFSSDDESFSYRQTTCVRKKSTAKNKQVMCVLACILNTLGIERSEVVNTNMSSEEECVRAWGEAKACTCVWQTQSSRRGSLIKKGNSFKFTSRGSAAVGMRNDFESAARQLSFGEDGLVPNHVKDHCDILVTRLSPDLNHQSKNNSLTEQDDETFYTPPTSPTFVTSSDEDEDSFEDSFLPEQDVFIDGSIPTKTDYAVYNAVMCSKDRLNALDYPNIYKWRHAVSLYPESEQTSWTSPSIGRCTIGVPSAASTPPRNPNRHNGQSPSLHTPPNSWLRITGVNSPRDSLKRYRRCNISFNL